MEKEYKIIDEAGLHARPASILSQTASKYPNSIFIEFNGKKLNLKSILMVMSLGVTQNSTIKIHVDGDDAETVINSLEKILVEHKLV
jgi:phosphocarrier protein